MGRRVVTKKTEDKKEVVARRAPFVLSDDDEHDDEQYVTARNRYARENGIDNSKPAERISRVVHIQFSAGDDMRNVDIHDFTQQILDAVGVTRYGEPGIHGTRMNGYYIVDGKLCHEVDFDWEKENFKDGRLPPEYAGGPKPFKPPLKPKAETKTRLLTSEQLKTQFPSRRTVRHHTWSDSQLETGRPDAVIDEEKHAKYIAEKLKAMRKNKKSASPEPSSRKRVVRKSTPEPVKKKVVVRRSK